MRNCARYRALYAIVQPLFVQLYANLHRFSLDGKPLRYWSRLMDSVYLYNTEGMGGTVVLGGVDMVEGGYMDGS